MSKRSWIILVAVLILISAGLGLRYLTSKRSETSAAVTPPNKPTVITVDDVVREPEKFAGMIGVSGSVTGVDESKSTFDLGCEDACFVMPVTYRGHLPKEGANVVAYGTIKKTEEAKYIFVAEEIAVK
jgi:cytochrome c-type biogenesis protein CcmE